MSSPIPDEARFARQLRFSGLGAAGQERLAAARVALVGCGALGGVLAQCVHRAGVGQLVLIDRDVVEPSNLPRQVLFDERHAQLGTPKVEAAAESLARAGGPTELVLHACHIDAGNADELLEGAQLVLDGSDNMATRYLLNDWCVRSGLPWVYAGVVGAAGCVLPVLPGRGACLRCLWPEEPPTGSLPTCDSAGVVLPGVAAVASMAAGYGLRILAGDLDFEPRLCELDGWEGGLRSLHASREPDCACCVRHEFPHLVPRHQREPVVLCGRNAVQLAAPPTAPDLDALAARLEGGVDALIARPGILRFEVAEKRVTLFADGRALVEGTDQPEEARLLYEHWVGR